MEASTRARTQATDESGSSSRTLSHGRGGAGNMAKDARTPADLSTPTIKSDIYTTGRGGSGNMAANDTQHPEVARTAQDVAPAPGLPRLPEQSFHVGRGGAANVASLPSEANGGRREEKSGGVGGILEKVGLKK